MQIMRMKNWRLFMFVLCAGSLSIGLLAQVSQMQASMETPPIQLSAPQLNQRALSITVKVLADGSLGSGILIRKKDSVYTVLTNAHVLKAGNSPYKIRTADGKIHETTTVTPSGAWAGKDLAVLQFTSNDVEYPVAKLGKMAISGAFVVAAGFPFSAEGFKNGGFVVKSGQVKLVLDKALEGGYRIGYTNEIEKGMSGGPILNRAGELIGINGIHAHPVWGDPYVFEDGSEPSDSQREQMSQYSWGIPVATFESLVSQQTQVKDLQ